MQRAFVFDREETTENALGVAIERRVRPAEGNAHQSTSCVMTNSGQRQKGVVLLRQLPTVGGDDLARALFQILGPTVVPKP